MEVGRIYYSFKKYCIATVTKLMLAAWKSVIEDQISKVNNENQWFCRYCIGIHRLPYEIIDNIFVNLCLENEEMHSIIALVCKKWSRHISKDFFEKVNFKWLDKEFKANEWSDENKRKYKFRFLLHDVLIVADCIK